MPVKKDQESNESFVVASFIECKKVKITRLTGTVQYMLRTALRDPKVIAISMKHSKEKNNCLLEATRLTLFI